MYDSCRIDQLKGEDVKRKLFEIVRCTSWGMPVMVL